MLRSSIRRRATGAILLASCLPLSAAPASQEVLRSLRIEPTELVLEIGETAQLKATISNGADEDSDARVLFYSRARRSVKVSREGLVTALKPGVFEIMVKERLRRGGEKRAKSEGLGERLTGTVEVTVRYPALERVEIIVPEVGLHTGTTSTFGVRAIDVNGDERKQVTSNWSTNDEAIATFDSLGELTIHRPGEFVAAVEVEGLRGEHSLTAMLNPIVRLELENDSEDPRTGDVVVLRIDAYDADEEIVLDVPIEVFLRARPDDSLGPAASGQIEAIPDTDRAWRFVAEQPGRYTFVAASGGAAGRTSIQVVERKVTGDFRFVGQARVSDTHTSDLWVWEGVDGRDYAVTGTWGANGDAHFWDVTDPANMERIATVNIDARTVNDVKVSADGRMCILSREGASDRRNGIVLVDVTDPHNPEIKSGFDEELTGGVHNVFIDEHYVYALSAGARYDTIDISDPGAPARVGSYKVDGPKPSIHDVWVVDGLAYSSNWKDGVHIVDVGNGVAGGSPQNPVKVSSYAYPNGWNHAAFPFQPRESGRFYVAAGDEAFPNGLNMEGKPTYPRGWIHFIDFTDMDNPRENARYQVPEAGTHNLWIEDDVMYVAYYNAGLRAVDVSGELMGDIYRQGREIAWFLPDDPEGLIANAPMAWGPQPHKGHVFFTDWNSGLWAVKLVR